MVQDFIAVRLKVIQIKRDSQLSIEFQQRPSRLPEKVQKFAWR